MTDLHALAAKIDPKANPNIRAWIDAASDILQPVTPPPPISIAWPANPWSPGVWNTPPLPANVAIDPHSADFVANMITHMATPGIAVTSWSVPVYVSSPSDTAYTVTCPNGNLASANPIRIPAGAKPDPEADGHLAVLDYATGRAEELGMYHGHFDGVKWSAAYGHAIKFTAANTPSNGPDDANIPLTAGLLTPEHFTGAVPVTYPLAFACWRGASKPRWPSTGGSGNNHPPNPPDQYGPVNGMWMILDRSYSVSQLAIPWERQVATWLQQRGMVCRDGSGNLSLYAENIAVSGRKAPAYPWGAGSPSFSKAFPWNRMQVLAVPVPYQP